MVPFACFAGEGHVIKVLYDNEALKGYKSGWGVSYLIDDRILFDAGDSFEPVYFNMKKIVGAIHELPLQEPLDNLKAIVISHTHADHIGGLWEILKRNPGIKVYVCPSFPRSFKKKISDLGAEVIEVKGLTEVSDGIYSTGELLGIYKGTDMPEQSLIIIGARGAVPLQDKKCLSIITGCAHPGIIKIIKQVKSEFPGHQIDLVMGGFHLYTEREQGINRIVKEFQSLGVQRVGPCHCSGDLAKNLFKKAYTDKYQSVKAGLMITLQ